MHSPKVVLVFLCLAAASAKDIPLRGINEVAGESLEAASRCTLSGGATSMMNCLGAKALKLVDEAARTPSIEILPGVSFVSENVERGAKELRALELPVDPKAQSLALVGHLAESAAKLVSGRSLSIKLPTISSENVARSLEEARGKLKKKLLNPLILGIAGKLALVLPLFIGAVGLLATKALFVAKIAFVLAAVLFASSGLGSSLTGGLGGLGGLGGKFSGLLPSPNYGGGWSGGSYGAPSYSYGAPGYSYGAPGNGGWTTNQLGRSITEEEKEDEVSAQELAYSQQLQ